MSEKHGRKPFVNAANKTVYLFAEGMSDEEAYRALLDLSCHSETDETHESPTGEIYRVVRVAATRPPESPRLGPL